MHVEKNKIKAFYNIFRGAQNVTAVELMLFTHIVLGTDLSGTPTKYSLNTIKSTDCNVPEKLCKVRLCRTA